MQSAALLVFLALASFCLASYDGDHHGHDSHGSDSSDMMEVSNDMSRHGRTSGDMLLTADRPMVSNGPAYHFQGRGVCLDDQMSRRTVKFIERQCNNSRCFSISSYVRVEKKQATGVVLSLRAGSGVVFDVVFKRNVQMRVRHTTLGGSTKWDRLYFEFELDQWYHMILTVCPHTRLITLHIDCNEIYRRNWDWGCQSLQNNMPEVCVGKLANNEQDQPEFYGSIQQLRLYRGRRSAERLCRSSGSGSVGTRVAFLEQALAEGHAELKECKRNYCTVNGTTYGHGQKVPNNRLCTTECHCKNGETSCTPQACPSIANCPPNRVILATPARGHCCNTCLPSPAVGESMVTEEVETTQPPGSCEYNGRVYANRYQMFLRNDVRRCRPCTCENGRMMCHSIRCPTLSCVPSMQYRVAGECCKQCIQHNRCAEEPDVCGPYSVCKNKPNQQVECSCQRGATKQGPRNNCHPEPTTAPPATSCWWCGGFFGK